MTVREVLGWVGIGILCFAILVVFIAGVIYSGATREERDRQRAIDELERMLRDE